MRQSPEDSSQSSAGRAPRARPADRERDRLDEAIIDYNRIVRRRRLSHISVEREYASTPGE